MSVRNQAFAPHPEQRMRYRFARALATRINAPASDPSPNISGLLSGGSRPHFPDLDFHDLAQDLARDLAPMTDTRTLVLIPARMAATRLPGLPMIVHVLRRAEAARIGRVAVATDAPEIAAAVTSHGGEAVMTRTDHPSGSDRIHEALGKLDPGSQAEFVVNLQGDFPTIRPDNIRGVMAPLADPAVDIATLAAEIHTVEESTNPNVVKI